MIKFTSYIDLNYDYYYYNRAIVRLLCMLHATDTRRLLRFCYATEPMLGPRTL